MSGLDLHIYERQEDGRSALMRLCQGLVVRRGGGGVVLGGREDGG